MRAILTAIVCIALLPAPFDVAGQPAKPRIRSVGVLAPQRLQDQAAYAQFLETLRELGYREGENLRLVTRSAEGKLDRLPSLAAELIDARVEVIVAFNTPAVRAAISTTRQIPIVMSHVGDPVGSGFVTSLARPGGNVTGVSIMLAELGTKRFSILKELVPSARRIAVLFNPEDPITEPQVRDVQSVAPGLNVETRFFPVRVNGELPAAFSQIVAWRAHAAMWLLGQQHALQATTIKLAVQHRLPVMVGRTDNVEAGGLISYVSDNAEVSRRVAVHVDRSLKGVRPSDLPVEQPTKFELAVNLRTAKALGITIPQSILLRADRVIE
jgi:putative ABC transport system substrate-binding protein